MEVRGRNLVTGLPRTVTVTSEETEEALREATLQIVEAVHSVLGEILPSLQPMLQTEESCLQEAVRCSEVLRSLSRKRPASIQ